MKSIMKKIAMMGMLSCMVSLNLYSNDHTHETPKHEDPKSAPKHEHPKYEDPQHEDPQYETPKHEHPKHEDPKSAPVSLQSQIDSLSKQFAAIPHDQKLDAEYKALTNAITDLLAPLKTGTKIDQTKKSNIQKNLDQFKIDINNDIQYKAYAVANPSTITTLNNSISNIVTQLQNINASSRPNNLMTEPTDENSLQQVNITVSNLPANTFLAAGVLYHYDGKTNYSIQGTGGNGSYTFYSNHYYAAAANDRKSFTNQHKGTDFLGKTKWDVTANIIS